MLVLLGISVFVYHFGIRIYNAWGLEPPPSFDFLYMAAFLCGSVWWLKAEFQRHSIKPVYCLGLLVNSGWIVIIPYYLFKTRGVRGVIPLPAMIGIMLAAHLLALLVFSP